VAVDAAGDVFVSDVEGGAVYEITAAGAQTTFTTVSGPEGLAVDGSGNLFLSEPGSGVVVKFARATPPTVSFPTATPAGSTDTTDMTKTVQVFNIGNQPLTFTSTGVSYPADFSAASDANACVTSAPLVSAAECDLPIQFTPVQIGAPLSEQVVLTDNALNVTGAQQSVQVSGTSTGSSTTTSASNASTAYSAGSQNVTLVATVTSSGGTVNSGTVTFTLVNGSSLVIGSPVTVNVTSGSASANYTLPAGTPAGTYTIEAAYSSSKGFAESSDSSHTLIVAPYPTPTVTLGTVPAILNRGTSVTLMATFTTISGDPAPTQPMSFYAGLTLLGTGALSGSGATYTATLTTAALPSGTQTIVATYPGDTNYLTASSTGQSTLVIANNLWIADSDSFTSAFSATGALFLSEALPRGGTGVAIDSTGNVWTLNAGSSSLSEFSRTGALANGGVAYTGGGLSSPTALAIDGSNQIWIANSSNSISVFNTTGSPVSSAAYTGGSLSTPTGVAIDISGNLWIANEGNNSVTEVLGAAAPTVPIATGVASGTPAAEP
jgi:sugar lactone lactonase YvrE